jgi:hypothetical protein
MSTELIAELHRLERDLGAAVRTKPTCSVTEQPLPFWPVGYVQGDPNLTVSDLPHVNTIREKLRARAKDLNADPAERQAAAEALRVMYRETI